MSTNQIPHLAPQVQYPWTGPVFTHEVQPRSASGSVAELGVAVEPGLDVDASLMVGLLFHLGHDKVCTQTRALPYHMLDKVPQLPCSVFLLIWFE